MAAAESRLVGGLPKILAGLVAARLLGGVEGTAGRGSFWVGDLEARQRRGPRPLGEECKTLNDNDGERARSSAS